MIYQWIDWKHELIDEPVTIISELDKQRNEIRKVEVFSDGAVGYATSVVNVLSTRLSLEPLPPLEDILSDPQFSKRDIEKYKFEEIWSKEVKNVHKSIENELNITFPTLYLNNLYNRCFMSSMEWILKLDDDERITFLDLDVRRPNNLLEVYREEREMLFVDVIPFAKTEFGDYICFNYVHGRGENPTVIYYSYNMAYENVEEAVFPICNSYENFIPMLNMK